MRTHLIHVAVCGDGEITAEHRTVMVQPDDRSWPKDVQIRVPYCTKCKTVVSVSECRDERLIPQIGVG